MGLFTDHAGLGDRNASQSTLPGELSSGHADQTVALPGSTASKPAVRDAAGDNPPLNFDQLVMRCMGRLELAQRLLTSFERRFPIELSQIEQCLETGDLPAFVRQTHQLKGASANVSAPALHAILKRIEEAGRVEQLEEVAAGLAELRGAWSEFQQYKAANCVSDTTQPGQASDANSGPSQNPEKPSCAF
jgi:HPt (histidine-containing phosphotransfer) domain-containing protein